MIFSYKAKSKSGEIIEGLLEAADRFALAHELRSRGYIPLSVSGKNKNLIDKLSVFEDIFSKVGIAEQIIFTKNLSSMIHAGLSLSRALSVLQKQTKNPTLNKILTSLNGDIGAGETFSSALSKFSNVFSKLFISMVRAGEESGNLSGALLDIGANLEKAHALTKRVRGALIYPGIILSAMVVIGILMFAFVVPTLANTFKELGVDLPLSTRIIIFLGNFFSNNLLLTFIIVALSAFGFYTLFRAKSMARYIDYIIIKLPVIGTLAKELNTARTTRTMSSLLLSGVSITRSIEITEEVVQNIYFKEVLKQAREGVEKGIAISKIFGQYNNLYPVMMSEMIEVGEETGKLSDMLLQVATIYEGEIENKTQNLSTIIEPILMIIIGAGVGFFAISMISPLYSVLDNIK